MSGVQETLKGKNLLAVKKGFYSAMLNGNCISLYNQRSLVSKFVTNDFDFVVEMLGMLDRQRKLQSSLVNHTIALIPDDSFFRHFQLLSQLNAEFSIDNYNAALRRLSALNRAQCVELFDSLAVSHKVNSASYKHVVKSILNFPINTSVDYVIIKRLHPFIRRGDSDDFLLEQLLDVFLMVQDNDMLKKLYHAHKLNLDNAAVFKIVNHFIYSDITSAQAILDDWLRFNQMTPSLHLLELKLTTASTNSS